MKKKAQIQMGENVIILFIFFILLVFAIVFFTRLQATKTQQKIVEDISGRGQQIVKRIEFLPETQCTLAGVETPSICYDKYNMEALQKLAEEGRNDEYYYPLFGFSAISVRTIYPDEGNPIVIYNNTNSNLTSIQVTSVPILLCDFISGQKCNFAVLKIETYN